MINHKHKNKIEHNEETLREIWNIEIWSTIPTSLIVIV